MHISKYTVVRQLLTLNIFGPTGSQIYRTGENEIPLEPQSAHENVGISHAQMGQSKVQTVTRAYCLPAGEIYFFRAGHFWAFQPTFGVPKSRED